MIMGRVIPSSTDDPETADAFYNDEASAESSQPREFCDIVHGATTYHIAFTNRDLRVNGVLYTAIAAARGEIGTNKHDENKELELILPIDHPLVSRYLQFGVPPQKITVTLWRRQERSGLVEKMWVGDITSMAVDDDNTAATFRIPARAGEALQRKLPTITVGKTCPHILYDSMCRVTRQLAGTYFVSAVLSITGRDVEVIADGSGHLGEWATGGELVHVPSGERMSIRVSQTINAATLQMRISLQLPLAELVKGDSVQIYAGCDHTMTGPQGCVPKFNNRVNFGGFPQLPTKNPMTPKGYGPAEGL